MDEITACLPGLSPVENKELCVRFDGGRLSSDGGVLVLCEIEKRLGLAARLAGCLSDARDPASTTHSYADMIGARMFAIACGYEDCDDLDVLRFDPAFKLACGRLPESGRDLMSQPTLSRLENAPSWRELARMGLTMIDLFCDSFERVPQRIVLDIDDTPDAVHGGQQLALFNAHYDEYCFQPGFPRWLLPIAEKSNTIGIPKAIPTRSCHDRLGSALDRVCLAMRNSAP